jgi:cytochrome c biogenesis protein CcmG/thiol:disulfide interchange protein DsbE
MKNLNSIFAPASLLALLSVFSISAAAQTVPNIQLKDMASRTVSTGDFIAAADGPILICFWATWCSPCKRELNAYMDYYGEWQKETGVELVAVSIDDPRSLSRVAPYVNSTGWDYTVWLDPNREFARSLGVINAPHTFLIDPKTDEIIWQHNSYADGDEDEVYEQLLKLVEKDD